MQLPESPARTAYIEVAKKIEALLKTATAGGVNQPLLTDVQARLDALAEKYQYSEDVGTARYKLYELQALVHYFNGDDDTALDFINQAIATRGSTYPRAEKIKQRLLGGEIPIPNGPGYIGGTLPLELQGLISGLRTAAIIMAVISAITIWFIPWTFFYIYMAAKLKPGKVPSRTLVKTAAIVTLPLCLGLIPILTDIELWRMNGHLERYERHGRQAFMPDDEWRRGDAKRQKSKKIMVGALLALAAILIAFIVFAVIESEGNYSQSSQSPTSLAEEGARQFKASSTLPQAVDETTTLTDVTAANGAIQYHYELRGIEAGSLTSDMLFNHIQPSVCSDSDTRYLLDAGVAMEYFYEAPEINRQYSTRVQLSDC